MIILCIGKGAGMEIRNNIDLGKYTTFHIGGNARNFYMPESTQELISCLRTLGNEKDFYILSGGSNLLINDKKIYDNVIYCKRLNDYIIDLGEGKYHVGAAVRIQKLINKLNRDGYGGIEYLYSLPALVGGIVVMNAGRGEGYAKSISDFIERVYIVRGGKELTVEKGDCGFGFRTSVFKGSKDIVVAVDLRMEVTDSKNAELDIRRRMAEVKLYQERNKANFGSVFSCCNPRIMNIMQKLSYGRKSGVHYSSKTPNWLVNEGKGTYKQAKHLIDDVAALHKIFKKECKVEVQIWD